MSENSIDSIIEKASKELSNFVEYPKLEIRAFLSFLLDKDKSFLISNSNFLLTDFQLEKVIDFINRRKENEPYPYIIGEQDFFGLTFKVNKFVLIPRPETEILVELAIKKALDKFGENPQKKLNILELGVGSGCISIALANYFRKLDKKIKIIGIEKSKAAYNVAINNLKFHKLDNLIEFINIDWKDYLSKNTEKFNLIISNPPYVELNHRHKSIELEPDSALFSGEDGLDDIKFLLTNLQNKITSDSEIFFEIGSSQVKGIKEFLQNTKSSLTFNNIYKDLAGLDRVISFKPKKDASLLS